MKLVFVLSLFINLTFSQRVIKGIITDSITNTPLANVKIFNNSYKTTTDFDGSFRIKIPTDLQVNADNIFPLTFRFENYQERFIILKRLENNNYKLLKL